MANRRFSNAEVMWIRWIADTRDTRYNTRSLATRFGVSEYTIREVRNNRVYRDLFVEDRPDVPDVFWRTEDPEQQLAILKTIDYEDMIQS